jgi:hypothetical protein
MIVDKIGISLLRSPPDAFDWSSQDKSRSNGLLNGPERASFPDDYQGSTIDSSARPRRIIFLGRIARRNLAGHA